MKQTAQAIRYAKLVAWVIMAYGLSILVNTLARQFRLHERHAIDDLLLTAPGFIGISYVYLGVLLFRLKYNAWLTAMILSAIAVTLNVVALVDRHTVGLARLVQAALHIAVPLLLLLLLYVSRSVFRVRSDRVGFRQAVQTSCLVLAIALVYGVVGFTVLDTHDFHREISLPTAIHQTVDQFRVTTPGVVAYTRRARLFMSSLSVISVGAGLYVVLAFFQPIRFRLQSDVGRRVLAEELLQKYPSDIDDFFKLWPHDKHYFFDSPHQTGLAYCVTNGVALVVGNPFGNPKYFLLLVQQFQDFCFVNDWRSAFAHVNPAHRDLYEKLGFRLQKIGEEAVLDLDVFQEYKNDKYFRQIRNRFSKLGYEVSLLKAPHSVAVLQACAAISTEWLQRPGRAERGFMMGHFTAGYLQQGSLAVVRDSEGAIRGFINVVPTFEPKLANFDMLRCSTDAPGNCNDFLLLGLIELLHEQGYTHLNLGLSPLRGLDASLETTNVIDVALRLVYANGDHFYSFSGLERFKAKYHPTWEDRYMAHTGGAAGFALAMTALTRAMKIK